MVDNAPVSSFQVLTLSSAYSFYASLLQSTDGVTSLALWARVVSQAPQYFRSPRYKQLICDGCFFRLSVCSVISLDSNMSSAVGYIQRRVGSYMSTIMTWLYKKRPPRQLQRDMSVNYFSSHVLYKVCLGTTHHVFFLIFLSWVTNTKANK